jgi:hypothetical protein
MIMKIVDYHQYRSVTETELDEFEKRYCVSLTTDFRNFLLQYNGGRPIPSFFWVNIDGSDGSNVFQFYGVHHQHLPPSLETYLGEERYGVSRTLLPIGDDGVGDLICMGIAIENLGKIYFLDHEIHPYNDPESAEGITILANSFSEFLASLTKSPDGDDEE